MPEIRVVPLEAFGAEIVLDLAGDLDEQVRTALRDLLAEHHLLVFRGQQLDLDRQVAVIAGLGSVIADEPDSTRISNQSADDGLGPLELSFHSDLSFSPEPYRVMSLAAVELRDGASSTRFANAVDAYASLPDDVRRRLDGLQALNVFSRNLSGRNREQDLVESDPRIVGPVVKLHPDTGEPLLWVNANATDRVLGLPPAESEELLDVLFAALYDDGNVQEHVWSNGDVVIWDNLAVQHARGDVSGVGIRILQKVVAGPMGFLEQHPDFGRDEFIARPEVHTRG